MRHFHAATPKESKGRALPGLKDFTATNWFCIAAPKGRPQAIIDRMQAEVKKAVRSQTGATVTDLGFRPGTAGLAMTDSSTGTVLRALLPVAGAAVGGHFGGA